MIKSSPRAILTGSEKGFVFYVKGKSKTEASREVGKAIAAAAKEKGIETVRFDRGGYRYHGRVKALAEGARENGLKV